MRGAAAGAVAAVAQRLPWATDENEPIVLLETDHRLFEDPQPSRDESAALTTKHNRRIEF